MIDQYIQKIKGSQDLEVTEAQSCLNAILENDYDDVLVADLLCALADKRESISEITGFANALLDKSVSLSLPREAIDLCGTGGVPFDRFNVSTARMVQKPHPGEIQAASMKVRCL